MKGRITMTRGECIWIDLDHSLHVPTSADHTGIGSARPSGVGHHTSSFAKLAEPFGLRYAKTKEIAAMGDLNRSKLELGCASTEPVSEQHCATTEKPRHLTLLLYVTNTREKDSGGRLVCCFII